MDDEGTIIRANSESKVDDELRIGAASLKQISFGEESKEQSMGFIKR